MNILDSLKQILFPLSFAREQEMLEAQKIIEAPKVEQIPQKEKVIIIPHYNEGLLSLKEDDTIYDFWKYCEALNENMMPVDRVFIPTSTYKRIYAQLIGSGSLKSPDGYDAYPEAFLNGKQSLLTLKHPVNNSDIVVFTVPIKPKIVG